MRAVDFAELQKANALRAWERFRYEMPDAFRERGDGIVANLRGTPAWQPVAEDMWIELDAIVTIGTQKFDEQLAQVRRMREKA